MITMIRKRPASRLRSKTYNSSKKISYRNLILRFSLEVLSQQGQANLQDFNLREDPSNLAIGATD
jgi:hypothetical protein